MKNKLKNVRENVYIDEKKLTQELLAGKVNIPLRTIRSYEQGTRELDNANISHVIKLAYNLNCKLEDILENKENIKMLKEIYK